MAGLPLTGENPTLVSSSITVPGLELPVQLSQWFSLKSRTLWCSLDTMLGACMLDNAGRVPAQERVSFAERARLVLRTGGALALTGLGVPHPGLGHPPAAWRRSRRGFLFGGDDSEGASGWWRGRLFRFRPTAKEVQDGRLTRQTFLKP